MTEPAFRLLEGNLRAFFARCCQDLTAHHSDPIGQFVRRCFTEKRVSSLDRLEIHEYCSILSQNLKVSKKENTVRLFERHEVPVSLPTDMRYCQNLRHKYDHLKGIDEVSSREQFSDLVILRRAVAPLAELRKRQDADVDLLRAIDRHCTELQLLLAEAAKTTAEFDEPVIPSEEKTEFAGLVAQMVAGSLRLGNASEPTREQAASVEILGVLHELRASAYRQPAGDAAPVISALEKLEERVVFGLRQLSERIERLAAPRPEPEPAEAITTDGNDGNSRDEELGALMERLVRSASRRGGSGGKKAHERLPTISLDEARDRLVALRHRIWRETGSGASSDGLLRKSVLEAFLEHRPTSEAAVQKGLLRHLWASVAVNQRPYLPDVIAILERLEPR